MISVELIALDSLCFLLYTFVSMIAGVILFFLVNDIYLIPNDAVEIKIWRQEDLSGWYLVDKDTSLTMPLLGKVSVRNVSTDVLYEKLLEEYRKYYADVYIDINMYYRVNIFGEVKSPGFYYVKSEDNLANLLAQAGGPTAQGTVGAIQVLNLGEKRVVNFSKILKAGKHLELLNLKPGDIVIVPRRFMPAFQEWSVLLSVGTLIMQMYIAAKP